MFFRGFLQMDSSVLVDKLKVAVISSWQTKSKFWSSKCGFSKSIKATSMLTFFLQIYIYLFRLCVDVKTSNLADSSRGWPKYSFPIATTLRCWEGPYSFPLIVPLIIDPYLIMLSVEQSSFKYPFSSLWHTSTWDWTLIFRTMGEHWPLCQWEYLEVTLISHKNRSVVLTELILSLNSWKKLQI